MLDEGCLNRVKIITVSQSFNGSYLASLIHHREGQARQHALTVHNHCTCAALSVIATFLRACKTHVLTQRIQQRSSWIDL